MHSFRVIDSHTGGEPTRTIVDGGPSLELKGADASRTPTVTERLEIMRTEFDHFRRSLVHEPRGSEVMVGALLVPPSDPKNVCGVIFFNNVGYLGMCGHGSIGVVETLRYLGRMQPGLGTIETCVGNVQVELHDDHRVTVANVPSHRAVTQYPLAIADCVPLFADIAYGGNWFCLVECPEPDWLDRSPQELIALSKNILEAVRRDHPQVDHVELFAPAKDPRNNARSFVLCPGGAYDRSPCGTGTSAKLACLAADGKLKPDTMWRQESCIGSVFEARFRWHDQAAGVIAPSIASRAYVNADLQILVHPDDPFGWGLP